MTKDSSIFLVAYEKDGVLISELLRATDVEQIEKWHAKSRSDTRLVSYLSESMVREMSAIVALAGSAKGKTIVSGVPFEDLTMAEKEESPTDYEGDF